MKKWKTFPLLAAIGISIVLLFGIYHWLKPSTSVKAYSQADAINAVEQLYGGSVLSSEAKGHYYIVTVEKDTGIYEAELNASTGEIHSLQLIENKNSSSNSSDENQSPLLSKVEIETVILKQTTGEIQSSVLHDEATENPYYEVIVNETEQKITFKVNAQSGEILDEQIEKQEETSTKLTKKEAQKIALNYLNGTVDNIELHSNGTQSYYLIEIEAENEEAEIQIHAVTGEILSVTWDEEDDDE